MPEDVAQQVRAPLARLRLEPAAQRASVRLLDEGRPRRALTSGDGHQLPEALVHHLREAWPRDRVLLLAALHRLTAERRRRACPHAARWVATVTAPST